MGIPSSFRTISILPSDLMSKKICCLKVMYTRTVSLDQLSFFEPCGEYNIYKPTFFLRLSIGPYELGLSCSGSASDSGMHTFLIVQARFTLPSRASGRAELFFQQSLQIFSAAHNGTCSIKVVSWVHNLSK